MLVNICYYGAFHEKTKKNSEVLNTSSTSVYELYEELKKYYDFQLSVDELLFAVNNNYTDDRNHKLNENDLITFLPPMSGG